jgi:2-oxoglutarate dehydrogenase E2 component (dihydrolipoamide succinyltransferase)
MSAFIKASVAAAQEQPAVNAMIDGEEIVMRDYVDVSVAVSTPTGLVTPVLRNCEAKSFADIEKDLAAYAVKARDGKISLEDLAGGTFTISNGGVFGSLMGTPILNPPQSAILGMHGVKNRPVCIGDQIVARPMMYLALTYDHRMVDGREAVLFLRKIKESIEDPRRLLLEV